MLIIEFLHFPMFLLRDRCSFSEPLHAYSYTRNLWLPSEQEPSSLITFLCLTLLNKCTSNLNSSSSWYFESLCCLTAIVTIFFIWPLKTGPSLPSDRKFFAENPSVASKSSAYENSILYPFSGLLFLQVEQTKWLNILSICWTSITSSVLTVMDWVPPHPIRSAWLGCDMLPCVSSFSSFFWSVPAWLTSWLSKTAPDDLSSTIFPCNFDLLCSSWQCTWPASCSAEPETLVFSWPGFWEYISQQALLSGHKKRKMKLDMLTRCRSREFSGFWVITPCRSHAVISLLFFYGD